jgi:hypothetical protein
VFILRKWNSAVSPTLDLRNTLMKNIHITLHPLSVLAGMALLGFPLIATGAFAPQGSSSDRDVSAIENVNEPHPRDYVRVDGATPFTVPTGKLFHLTGLGGTSNVGGNVWCVVDNSNVAEVYAGVSEGSHCSLKAVPPGHTFSSGQIMTLAGSPYAVAMGYLVDA